jgi:2,4-dienoyl-CoA reductase-like NADH-dependent reductase (Old Yellow Enzyme family)/thioredoxin reductase
LVLFFKKELLSQEHHLLKHLFKPIQLGKLEIRNRIVLTGHGTGMGRDFLPDEQMIAYYAQRARGEVGLIMLGSQQVHPTSPGITGLLCNYDDRIIPGLRAVADAVHAHGGRIFGYLSHMGLASSARPKALWSASSIYEQKYGETAHAMTVAEIEEIIEAFATAALRCMEAGMDGLQIHCGHGLLLQQFLSPLTNHRNDEYGGSLENRVRFPAAVLREVRKQVGDDVPLGIRCSGDELIQGGLTAEDMADIVPLLVQAGRLDYVDVSAGSDGDLVSNMLHEPPMGRPNAPFTPVARAIRQAIAVPVIHGTRIDTPELADAMIARGDADMAGMCRALIADPFLPIKARNGKQHEVIPCVACEQACFGRLHRGMHISCVGNPATGRELSYGMPAKTGGHANIIVVGGGPAGMEAALQARLRGHEVLLIESAARLGGRLRLAMIPSGREEWGRLLEHKIAAVERAGVELRLQETADVTMLSRLAPDTVILATGAKLEPPPLPGANEAPLCTVDHAVANPPMIGRKVLVIDYIDRQPGLVTAIMLAQLGRDVTMATKSLHVGQKLESQNLTEFYRRAGVAGVKFLALAEPVAYAAGQVRFKNPITGETSLSAAYDSIVVAAPGLPQTSLCDGLKAAGIAHVLIGDAYAPRDIEAAILEGFEVGRRI